MKHNLFPKTKNKAIVLLASLAVLLMVSVTGTLAYLIAQTSPVVNTFTPGNVKPIVSENFDGKSKTNVKIQNAGNVDAYIRAEIVVNWVKDNGKTVYWKKPVEDVDYVIDYSAAEGINNTPEKWIKGNDGFYYWPEKVSPTTLTEKVLIQECKLKDGVVPPTGYVLSVEILSQAIQADGTFDANGTTKHPVENAWGVTLDTDGITIKSKN